MGMSRSGIGYVNDIFGNDSPGKIPIYGWAPGGMGCSGGCECCWARKLAKRMVGKCDRCARFEVHLHPERLGWPAKTRKPGVVLVNFTCDTLDEHRPGIDIISILYEAHRAPQHTYAWLTQNPHVVIRGPRPERPDVPTYATNIGQHKNWYLGLTIRTQAEADEKLPVFLKIPGKLWLSLEPLWEGIDLRGDKTLDKCPWAEWRKGYGGQNWYKRDNFKGVILGHDNRKGAPGTDTLDHIRSVVEQCKAAGVPVYVKQIWKPYNILAPIATHIAGQREVWKLLRASKPAEYALYPPDLKHRELPWAPPKPS